jgi:uncharacterized membrane protein
MSDKSSSTISIDAPLDQVAATLFAIAEYPQWSGAFKKVDVLENDDQGRATKVTFSLEDANILTKMDGAYLLKSLDSDTTSVTYELSVGLSMPIPAMMITKQEKSTIESALKQLKEHIEG